MLNAILRECRAFDIQRQIFRCPPGLRPDVYQGHADKFVATPSTPLADIQVELNKLASDLTVVCLSNTKRGVPTGKKKNKKNKKKKANTGPPPPPPPPLILPTQKLDLFRPYVIIGSKIDTDTNALSVSLFAPTFFHETSEECAGDIWVDVSKLRVIPESSDSHYPWRDPENASEIITLDWERDCAQRMMTFGASMLRRHHGRGCPVCRGTYSIMHYLSEEDLKKNWPNIKLPSRFGAFHVPCPSCIGARAIASVSDWSPFVDDEEELKIWHLWWAIMKMDESWLKAGQIDEMQRMAGFFRNIAEEEYYAGT
ncbi:hypothetical protein C8R43DRAFT_561271 [Mycena crocata]|nr:hypothetical protein C8R43DRAFT_561271 [Mycena crocata]